MTHQENDTILRVLTLLMLLLTLVMCISVFTFQKSGVAPELKNPLGVTAKPEMKSAKSIQEPVKFYTEPNINYSAEKNIFQTVRKVKA